MPYFWISSALLVGGLYIVVWLHDQYHLDIVVDPAPPPSNGPLISICIPARNEERNIRACLESVLNQDYPNLEIIVVDDCSTDSTFHILKDFADRDSRLCPVNGSDLPPGWAGKPHALHQASTLARGDWFCFVDADTFLAPETVSSCYAKALETNADMFTIMTFQILGSFWEKMVMPLVMTALSAGFPPRKVNDPNRRNAIANGQFILIKRSVYDAFGGHESVKDNIVEDKAISEKVKWNGYRLILADGMKTARTRMYSSLAQMWEGWTKNIYLGLRDQKELFWLGIFGVFLTLMTSIFLPVWPLLGLYWYLEGGSWMAVSVVVESLAVWTYLIYKRAIVSSKMGISPWYALTTPLGAAVFGAMMCISTWNVISKSGVTWRGRVYKVH